MNCNIVDSACDCLLEVELLLVASLEHTTVLCSIPSVVPSFSLHMFSIFVISFCVLLSFSMLPCLLSLLSFFCLSFSSPFLPSRETSFLQRYCTFHIFSHMYSCNTPLQASFWKFVKISSYCSYENLKPRLGFSTQT